MNQPLKSFFICLLLTSKSIKMFHSGKFLCSWTVFPGSLDLLREGSVQLKLPGKTCQLKLLITRIHPGHVGPLVSHRSGESERLVGVQSTSLSQHRSLDCSTLMNVFWVLHTLTEYEEILLYFSGRKQLKYQIGVLNFSSNWKRETDGIRLFHLLVKGLWASGSYFQWKPYQTCQDLFSKDLFWCACRIFAFGPSGPHQG